MKKTLHAIARAQQRGIKSDHIKLIQEYGTEISRPGKVTELRMLDKDAVRAINEAHKEYKRKIQNIEKCKNKGVLIDFETNTIITVYPIRRKQKPHYPDLAA